MDIYDTYRKVQPLKFEDFEFSNTKIVKPNIATYPTIIFPDKLIRTQIYCISNEDNEERFARNENFSFIEQKLLRSFGLEKLQPDCYELIDGEGEICHGGYYNILSEELDTLNIPSNLMIKTDDKGDMKFLKIFTVEYINNLRDHFRRNVRIINKRLQSK